MKNSKGMFIRTEKDGVSIHPIAPQAKGPVPDYYKHAIECVEVDKAHEAMKQEVSRQTGKPFIEAIEVTPIGEES